MVFQYVYRYVMACMQVDIHIETCTAIHINSCINSLQFDWTVIYIYIIYIYIYIYI